MNLKILFNNILLFVEEHYKMEMEIIRYYL